MEKVIVKWAKIHEEAEIPEYAHHGDAGFDFKAIQTVCIMPNERKLIKTGLKIELPTGFELQIRPRSGLSLNSPLIMPNSPGTIDSGYRGEIGIILWNASDTPYIVSKGARIAQGVIQKVPEVEFIEINASGLSETARGEGGFGSTGH